MRVSDLFCAETQLRYKSVVHSPRVGRAFGFRHHRLRHDAVFFYDVYKHVPLSSVVHSTSYEKLYGPVLNRKFSGFYYSLEEMICLLELVPEHYEVLAEFEIFQFHLLHGADSKKVEACEQPASSRALLICDAPIIEHVGERVVSKNRRGMIECDFAYLRLRQYILSDAIRRIAIKPLTELFDKRSVEFCRHFILFID